MSHHLSPIYQWHDIGICNAIKSTNNHQFSSCWTQRYFIKIWTSTCPFFIYANFGGLQNVRSVRWYIFQTLWDLFWFCKETWTALNERKILWFIVTAEQKTMLALRAALERSCKSSAQVQTVHWNDAWQSTFKNSKSDKLSSAIGWRNRLGAYCIQTKGRSLLACTA